MKWISAWETYGGRSHEVALADLDNDSDVEILVGHSIYDHNGQRIATLGEEGFHTAPTAADLDGDGDLEIVTGTGVYHHDGTLAWDMNLTNHAGFPQVADFDDDPEPEVLVASEQGFSLFEHDGTPSYVEYDPVAMGGSFNRPATIHNLDNDDDAEFAVGSATHFRVFESDGTIRWSAEVVDRVGTAGSTAFDFLGDGQAEAMYADEYTLFVFDGAGTAVVDTPRSSMAWADYPVVADIDNDGSAEILVVSSPNERGQTAPAVQAIRDVYDRWIPARRIWNQHTYHVTNVREDGTIPQHEPRHWEQLNTFRTQAQIESGGVCAPRPEG